MNIESGSLNTSKYKCICCNKEYTKKSSLDNHKIVCEFKMKTKREIQIETEESGDIPNYLQLVKIVQDLTMKMIKMQEKMDEMQKYVNKKKKKVNIIGWLNENIIPTVGFNEWINNYIIVIAEHFENLLENNLFHTLQLVFEYNLNDRDSFIFPIRCFTEKSGIFYIAEKYEGGVVGWRILDLDDMVLLLRKIHNLMIKELTKWKMANQYQFDDNDKISVLFNKAVIKLMNMSFTMDSSMSRVKNGLYNYLKKDIKTHIEYDFE